MLHHVIQKDMFHEFGFHTLIRAMEENEVPYCVVKIIPFSHELTWESGVPLPESTVPTMIWGMTCVEEVAGVRQWTPGVFKNENFDLRVIGERYGENMLNADAKFCRLGDIPAFEGSAFIRPVHDTKSFTGALINGEDLRTWQDQLMQLKGEFTTLSLDTPVLYASPKKIDTECRFFVVDGKVITGSSYRVNGRVLYKRVNADNPMCIPLREFAQRMVDQWQPVEAFVIDIGRVGQECKVIEINCLNSSGFYDSDMAAVVRAITNLPSLDR
jgi:hypothetical protein